MKALTFAASEDLIRQITNDDEYNKLITSLENLKENLAKILMPCALYTETPTYVAYLFAAVYGTDRDCTATQSTKDYNEIAKDPKNAPALRFYTNFA